MKKYLIIVGGATASGKTALSIELARHFDAPILSADSRQFYKEMRIGNARPTADELSRAKHYFIADRSVEAPLSAGAFAKEAMRWLEGHYQQHDYAVLTGGSGLFLKAITEGLNAFPVVSQAIRTKVDLLFEENGLEGLQIALAKADPDYYNEVDQNNASRLRRALEVCYSAEHPFSYYRKQNSHSITLFTPIYLHVSWPRELLYERINNRVEVMLEEGLEQEARDLYKFKHIASLKTVGYQEWFAHFDNEYGRERAIELIKQNSRRYAKRQLTWFRRDGHWKHIFKGDLRSALAYIQMVQSTGWSLVGLERQEQEEAVSLKYKVIRIGLRGKQENEIIAQTILWKYKKEAWLKQGELLTLNHLEKTILIHETLHRSECEKIYTCLKDEQLKVMGFRTVEFNSLPTWLKSKVATDTAFWCWERSKQEF